MQCKTPAERGAQHSPTHKDMGRIRGQWADRSIEVCAPLFPKSCDVTTVAALPLLPSPTPPPRRPTPLRASARNCRPTAPPPVPYRHKPRARLAMGDSEPPPPLPRLAGGHNIAIERAHAVACGTRLLAFPRSARPRNELATGEASLHTALSPSKALSIRGQASRNVHQWRTDPPAFAWTYSTSGPWPNLPWHHPQSDTLGPTKF